MLKPWKDGFWENLSKILGWYFAFLFLSGIAGAEYDPIWTNPYAWGWQIRATVLNVVGR